MSLSNITPEREAFNKAGFFIAKQAVDRGRLAEVVDEIRAVFCDQLKLTGVDAEAEQLSYGQAMKRLFDLDLKRYLYATSVLARLSGIARLLHSNAIWDSVQRLGIQRAAITSHPVTHLMSPDLQIPNGYYGLDAHQDWPALQGSLDVVVVWAPLVDIDAGMNALELIPGSHRLGLLQAIPSQNESVIDPQSYDEKDFIQIEVNAGDVVFFSAFTIHRSGKVGRTGFVRLACSTRFENLEEATFVDRGYPSAHKRSIDRKLVLAGFPTQEKVLKIFGER